MTWTFESGVEVWEGDSYFACYDGDGAFLGYIDFDPDDRWDLVALLDEGHDPVAEGWETGDLDHCCTMAGWAYDIETGEFGKIADYIDGRHLLWEARRYN